MTFLKRFVFLAALVLPIWSVIGCLGSDDDPSPTDPGDGAPVDEVTVRDGWGGLYQFTLTPADGRGQPIVDFTTMCAGQDLRENSPLQADLVTGLEYEDISCSGEWTDATADVTCTGAFAFEGCTISGSAVLDIDRTATGFVGTMSQARSFTGGEFCAGSVTEEFDIAATLLEETSNGCESRSDVLDADWTGDWSITVDMQTCDGSTLDGFSAVLSFCDGDAVIDALYGSVSPGEQVTWKGGADGDDADLIVFESEQNGDCFERSVSLISLARDGDALSGSYREYTMHLGPAACGDMSCESGTLTGSRASTSTSDCGGFSGIEDGRIAGRSR